MNKYSFYQDTVNETLDITEDGTYNIVVHAPCDMKLDVKLATKGKKVTLNYLFLGKGENVKSVVDMTIQESGVEVEANMFVLLGEKADINVEGNIHVNPGVAKVKAVLNEEALYLDDHAAVKMMPRLNVRSNDLEASHGAKIERLSEARMFYIQSKGLSMDEAQKLVVSSYINRVLENHDNLEPLKDKYLTYLLEK